MKKLFTLSCIFSFLFVGLVAESQESMSPPSATSMSAAHGFNGWEFLEWGSDRNNVEKALKQKKYEPETNDQLTRFHHEELELDTWLYYEKGELHEVVQQQSFHLLHREDARVFFEKTNGELTNRYGHSTTEKNDSENEIITITWLLKHTQVLLIYDYGHKVVDELGVGSYTVEVHYQPIEK